MAMTFSNSEIVDDVCEAHFIRMMGTKVTLVGVEEVSVDYSFNIFGSEGKENVVA